MAEEVWSSAGLGWERASGLTRGEEAAGHAGGIRKVPEKATDQAVGNPTCLGCDAGAAEGGHAGNGVATVQESSGIWEAPKAEVTARGCGTDGRSGGPWQWEGHRARVQKPVQ